ncbi:insulinase family protein [Kineobactrum salinum]|uniref:Peptidase M16 n=1 Tax=Kineobactrum salinum TaxID=2708301 RepID=A0A6C0TXC4_9GAMM|nr:insulinase family protein [Kineobactrum salinum]QIB64173.1 peptidase M16 [Kineobactrum salinum]
MTQTSPARPASQNTFELLRSQEIETLQLRIEQYQHRRTGAMHYHLAADSEENVFLVALRTVPRNSTGVAHILEHTALCGSERYPVRDPFFMMLRRSLNTFMNAFTSSDWTAYPFASQNRKDFANLLDVYLDAVFFSRLDPLDFAQEGHRVEFSEPGNPDSELVFKGVVFNEMKGAMSSVNSTLWQTLCEHVFPTNTYHYNSGGDPEHIPDLSYEELLAFYRSHYHPSNAIFMTFGDIPASEHQAVFEQRALTRFERLPERIEVALEQRLPEPLRVQRPYALDEEGDTARKTHIVIGWLLGESTDLEAMLEAQLLASVLLDNSASPLMHALETTTLGQSPSPLCGLEDSQREMVFSCGIAGSEADCVEALEQLVLGVIRRVADEGVPAEQLAAVLHQLELQQREISGGGFPYGLQLILQALGPATHYADPVAVLDLDPVLARLQQNISDPDYIKDLAQRILLDNPHRVTLVMTPDTELSSRRLAAETRRLAAIKAGMDDAAKQAVIALAEQLEARQQRVDDMSILPKVTLKDVPTSLPEHKYTEQERNGVRLSSYSQGTNGLVYQQLVTPLPLLSETQLPLLPLYTQVLTEVGLGDQDYLAVQHRQAATVGGISASTAMRGAVDDEQTLQACFALSSQALARNVSGQIALMQDNLLRVRFDEPGRLRELISQQRARREQSVTGSGHGLAMTAASAGMSPLARLQHELTGLEGLRQLKALDDGLASDSGLQQFTAGLQSIHDAVIQMPRQLLAIADEHAIEAASEQSLSAWSGIAASAGTGASFQAQPIRQPRREFWLANTQVNFCARAYPTVPVGHPDAAALTVLGGFLRNGFLHRSIREQGGAYGGGASQDSGIAAFRFFSYRDPRLLDTLQDFDQSIAWMLENKHEQASLEEAVLGVIGSMDKPGSPAGEAKQHFYNRLFGRSHQHREQFRRAILAVSLEDLRRVTELYLDPARASTAVVSNRKQLEALGTAVNELGLMVQQL